MSWYRDVYLRSSEWKTLRAAVLCHPIWRGKCWACQRKKKCDAHHLRYRNIHDVRPGDLIPLCRACHKKTHSIVRKGVPNSLLVGGPRSLGRFRSFLLRFWEILNFVKGDHQVKAISGLCYHFPECKKFVDYILNHGSKTGARME